MDWTDRPSSFAVRTLLFVFFCVLFVVCLGPAVRALSRPLLFVWLSVRVSVRRRGWACFSWFSAIYCSLARARPSVCVVCPSVRPRSSRSRALLILASRFSSRFLYARRPSSSSVFRLSSSVFRLRFPLLSLSLSRLYIVARTHARTYIRTCIHPHARTYVRAHADFFSHTPWPPHRRAKRDREMHRYRYVTATLLLRYVGRRLFRVRIRICVPVYRTRFARAARVRCMYIHTRFFLLARVPARAPRLHDMTTWHIYVSHRWGAEWTRHAPVPCSFTEKLPRPCSELYTKVHVG